MIDLTTVIANMNSNELLVVLSCFFAFCFGWMHGK